MSATVKFPEIALKSADLSLALQRLVAHDDHSVIYTESLARDFADVGLSTGSADATAQSHMIAAQIALVKGELCRALIEWERGMCLKPYDLGFQLRERGILGAVSKALDEMGKIDPGNAEFGRAYAKMLDFGDLAFTTHLSAILHYVLSCNFERAKDLATRAYKTGPNMPGLRELMRIIARETDDMSLSLLAETGDPNAFNGGASASCLSASAAAELLPRLIEINALLEVKETASAMAKLDEVLPKSTEFDERLVEFYYHKALALDQLEKYRDAFEIFWKVKEARPDNPVYARSFRIQIGRLLGEAHAMYEKDPFSPVLKTYYQLFKEHWFTPGVLAEAVSLIEIKEGDRQLAKDRMLAVMALSPRETDFILSSQKVARALDDDIWLQDLNQRLVRIRLSRPWDLTIQK